MTQGQEWKITGYIQSGVRQADILLPGEYRSVSGFIEFQGRNGVKVTRMFFANNECADGILESEPGQLVTLIGEHHQNKNENGHLSKMIVRQVELYDDN